MAAGPQGRPRSIPEQDQTTRRQSAATPRLVSNRPGSSRPDTAAPPMGKVASPTIGQTELRPRAQKG